MSHVYLQSGAVAAVAPYEFRNFGDSRFFIPLHHPRWNVTVEADGRLYLATNTVLPTQVWARGTMCGVQFRPSLYPDPVTREIVIDCRVEQLAMGTTDGASASADNHGVGIGLLGNVCMELQGIGRNGFVNANPRMSNLNILTGIDDTAPSQVQDTADRVGAVYDVRWRIWDDYNTTSPYGRKADKLVSIDGAAFVQWRTDERGYQWGIGHRGYRFSVVGYTSNRLNPAFGARVTRLRVVEGLIIFQ